MEKIQDILQWEKCKKNYIENLPHLNLSLTKLKVTNSNNGVRKKESLDTSGIYVIFFSLSTVGIKINVYEQTKNRTVIWFSYTTPGCITEWMFAYNIDACTPCLLWP